MDKAVRVVGTRISTGGPKIDKAAREGIDANNEKGISNVMEAMTSALADPRPGTKLHK